MEWLKMSPEYRVHTAIGNDGYEGPVPWMKTRQEISVERSKKMKLLMLKLKMCNARIRLKKLEYKLRTKKKCSILSHCGSRFTLDEKEE